MLASLFLLSCSSQQLDSATMASPTPNCTEIMNAAFSPTTMDDITAILSKTRRLVPELDAATIELRSIESESTFLAANVDLSTIGNAPFDRTYIIQINPVVLETGLSGSGLVAILMHELKHVLDYTDMDSLAFAEFGLWYAQGEIAEYERQTDLFSMERGCAEGLIEFRVWLYDQISADVREEKERNYYTPEEINTWMQHN